MNMLELEEKSNPCNECSKLSSCKKRCSERIFFEVNWQIEAIKKDIESVKKSVEKQ